MHMVHTMLRGHHGQYTLMSKAGKGGFATVYQAEMELVGMPEAPRRIVALKEIRLEKEGAQESSLNEMGWLRLFHHPGIPRLYDAWQDGQTCYLVMDWIEGGETLEDYWLRRERWLSVEEALRIGLQLCAILAYLHGQTPPVIYRDLKPTNVMRAPDGQLFLIDFGLARSYKPGQARDTQYLGSLGYAAPEQYEGMNSRQSDERTDIWGLGVLLHQLITGSPPPVHSFKFAPLSIVEAETPALTSGVNTLLQSMLSESMENRPSLATVSASLKMLLDQQVMRRRSCPCLHVPGSISFFLPVLTGLRTWFLRQGWTGMRFLSLLDWLHAQVRCLGQWILAHRLLTVLVLVGLLLLDVAFWLLALL